MEKARNQYGYVLFLRFDRRKKRILKRFFVKPAHCGRKGK